ncbi:MAG TPA: tetratricopeptide repeat protein, partial [Candidatus Polarisedimenticolia bacterium]|nr:tetratricopeptide repeat protein [Candidatus Polarisedimenticolia bacterium]
MPRDPRAYLQRAEEHRRHGRLKEAIALSIEALGKHPGLDAVRVTLGRAYLENAQPEEARTTLLEVFARLPEHHLAGKLLIESQRLLEDLGGAEATCRTLLEHYPRDREIEPLLAEIVRARSKSAAEEAPAGPVAPAATAPPAAAAPARPGPSAVPAPPAATTQGPRAPAVAVAEPDPAPEYFPEDLAAAPGAPVPQPAAARAAAPPAAKPAAPPAVIPSIAPTSSEASVAAPAAAQRVAAAPVPPIASVAAPARPASPAAPPSAGASKDALETNTLAELYVKQGLPDRAIDVYRSMLRVEPGNAAAKRRLAELESAAPPAVTAAAARPAQPDRAQPSGPDAKTSRTAAAPPATPPRP